MKLERIDKEDALKRWESIYAEAVLEMQKDGLFIKSVKSHTGGRDKIVKTHPAFAIFKEAADQLAKYNEWHKESSQLELNLDYEQ